MRYETIAGSSASVGHCVRVACKDRPEAARAIRDARPLPRVAERAILCAVAEREAEQVAPARLDAVPLWLPTLPSH